MAGGIVKGFAENANGWWYCKKGMVQFGVTDIIEGVVDGKNGEWRVVKGKVTGKA